VPIPVDGEGLRTDLLPPTRLAYVTPSHQFPLGSVLSAGRRRALLVPYSGSSASDAEANSSASPSDFFRR
jgi:GntR family transcriptional regulator / MocR family aminotransferase